MHRVVVAGERHGADAVLDLLDGELLAGEVALHERLVVLGDGLEQRLAVLRDLVLAVGRDLLDGVVLALRDLAAPGERPHPDEVDDPVELGLGAHRQLQDQRVGVQPLLDGPHGEVEVRTELVHLVDEADARDVVGVGLTPHRLRLGLDTLLAVEHGDGAVEHAQRALHLDGEVDVPGGVDDVDLVVFPEGRRRGGRDRDAALLLLLHPVHRGRAVVDLTDLVVDAGVVQDAFGRGGLARVDVGHDPDVADLAQVGQHVACHEIPLPSRFVAAGLTRRRMCAEVVGPAPGGSHRGGVGHPPPATSGSGRTPCSTRPSCACPRAA